MAEDAEGALTKALMKKLKAAPGVYGNKVYPDAAPPSSTYPYCVFFWAGGGEIQAVMEQRIEEHVISVKCVSDDIAEAFLGKAQISDALRHQGEQEVTSGAMTGGDDWTIVKVFKDRNISAFDPYADVQPVYHRGNQYEIRMEAK